jgi:predicted acyl esterase
MHAAFFTVFTVLLIFALGAINDPAPEKSAFTFKEVMVPTRDGIGLQTVILTPIDQHRPPANSAPTHSLRRPGQSAHHHASEHEGARP